MSTNPKPKKPAIPLTPADHVAFHKAVIDDLKGGSGYPALQSWMSNLSDGKANAGNELLNSWSKLIDTLRRRMDGDA